MTTTFFLIRHGESEVNADPALRAVYTGRNTWSELTENGKRQARELGRALRGEVFNRVIASTTVRTQQTARHFLRGIGRDWPRFEVAQELAEIDHGNLEGNAKGPEPSGPGADFWRFVPAGGRESLEAVAVRAGAWLEATARSFGSGQDAGLAVITHENVIKSLLVRLLNADHESLHHTPIPPCHFVVLVCANGAWRLARDIGGHNEWHLGLALKEGRRL